MCLPGLSVEHKGAGVPFISLFAHDTGHATQLIVKATWESLNYPFFCLA